MSLGYTWPRECKDFWTWAYHTWKIAKPSASVAYRYDREDGMRILGLDITIFTKGIPGTVI